jgi:hypothetical protein
MLGMVGAGGSIFADASTWLDPLVRGITFYGGAIVVILTAISFALDIRRKWKIRNHRYDIK